MNLSFHTPQLRAFTGTRVSKDELVASLEAHAKADRFVQGTYWDNGRGCAVGCSLHDFGVSVDDHGQYEPLFGIPRVLARLEDGIFENLPIDAAKEWPLRFARAVPVGADLSLVWPKFAVWMLVDKDHGVVKFAKENGKLAIEAVAALYTRVIAGETVTKEEFRQAAADAADAAAGAADAAADAADAAADAAYAYAAAAYADADADAYAAYAAYAAADARRAFWRVREDVTRAQADTLIRLLETA